MAAPGEKRPQKRKPMGVAEPRKPFKKKPKKDEPPPPPPPSSLILQTDDTDFPRGGASLLSRQEKAEARAEAEAEFERDEGGSKKGRKKTMTKHYPKAEDDDIGSLFGDGIKGSLPKFANRITFKNISPRMKLWGVIVEVNTKDLVISLPGGLRGFVRADEVSDITLDNKNKESEINLVRSIFSVGQLVSCIVLRVNDDKDGKGNKRIWLSLRLSLLYKGLTIDAVQDGMVMTSQVKSIEDRGYILHFGVPSFSGFLPRSERGDGEIRAGQLLQCVVKSIDKVRAIAYLNADPDMVSKCITKDLKGLSIDLLVPGMMVNARVHATLRNGIMLSFLTYFTGTVDIFHLQNSFATGSWKDDYTKNKKINARILFIDPSTRAVGLTLNSHLVHNEVPPSYVNTGDIYDNSRVLRVDREAGLLLEVPSIPEPSPVYVSTLDASDGVSKLEKKFKEGAHVRVRVLGRKHLEGLAIGTLKASALEGSIFTHSDVKPGMLVKAKVITVDSLGAIVQFSSGMKALCPLLHMSELEIVKPSKKFKVGVDLTFRVLGCKSKRITVTHKKSLVKSKLDVLASYTDATEGLITHGWITGIEKHGCFVKFYNGVQGFAHKSELDLDPGSEASAIYHVGQVVKCRIISSTPSLRKINVSFVISPKSVPKGNATNIGSLVSGVVERLTPSTVIVYVNKNASLRGTIANDHLADNHGQVTVFRSLLQPGYEFEQLLVLDNEGNNLILSAKYSLVNAAQGIPSDVAQFHTHSVIYGYICNIIETGCFVRFLGRLTGFSPKNQATDARIDNLSDAFYVGQSVRSHILDVNSESTRIKLSLKQSLCFSTDVSFIRDYFLLEEKIAALQTSGTKYYDPSWVKSFSVGSVVEGVIQEEKEFGVVVSFKDHEDVVGFIAHHQLGGINVEVGIVITAMVLDIAKSDGLVDLSLKPDLVSSANANGRNGLKPKKKRHREACKDLKLHQSVDTVVEIVKENYVVLSLPEYNNAIGYASITDYNMQKLCQNHFANGQRVLATVEALPSPHSIERLLLLLKPLSEVPETSSSKRVKRNSSYSVGSVVEAEIIDIKPLEMLLKFGGGCTGRVHITEVFDDESSLENPFSDFRIGQLINAKIVPESRKMGKGPQWEFSVKPSVLAGISQAEGTLASKEYNFSVGNTVRGYVVKVDNEWVWLTISRHDTAHLFILDSSCEPGELEEFNGRFNLGQAVISRIISVNKEKRLLRLVLRPSSFAQEIVNCPNQESKAPDVIGTEHIFPEDIIGGRIKKILPGVGGILVQIGPHLYGRVHYTELVDSWLDDPLSGYLEGQFVKCKVLEISRSSDGFLHVDLSLRSSVQGKIIDNLDASCMRLKNIDDLHPNMVVQGYVKNVTTKGCFITLSRSIDARILLSKLSDGYIADPGKEFPVGRLVKGRVLSVDPSSKKVDVTLKSDNRSQMSKADEVCFHNLHVGDVIRGRIRRTESYGLFITIDHSSLVGLCHISEISDVPIDNLEAKYKAGEKVEAKILKIDEERQRISLGMKKSDTGAASTALVVSTDAHNDTSHAFESNGHAFESNDNTYIPQSVSEPEENRSLLLVQAESRASFPPLQVSLGDSEDSDDENHLKETEDIVQTNDALARKNERRLKKKAKEERELEICSAEERSLQNDLPRTEDEFERLTRSSPNSSFVWIKYMAFMLSLADVEKARAIAERALNTISFREQKEKFNIWVAYFNLESEYGNPPEEAVKKTFERALQLCDRKKLHVALLGIYEKTEQYDLANELLDKMTKKYKNSCKVWLHCIQNLLKQGKEGCQTVVNRALLCLPRHKHIKLISQAAILEYKCGVPERGRSMFEGMLREYPKRTDLWSVYLDQEIRLGDFDVVRLLFERATCLSLPPKKTKFLFKKFLEFEKSHGDEDRIEHVMKKAREYQESLLA